MYVHNNYVILERIRIYVTTVTVTALANSLEASLIVVAKQGGRESTGGSELTLHQSLRLRKDKHMCHDPQRKKTIITSIAKPS
jgi:hypothetical protein